MSVLGERVRRITGALTHRGGGESQVFSESKATEKRALEQDLIRVSQTDFTSLPDSLIYRKTRPDAIPFTSLNVDPQNVIQLMHSRLFDDHYAPYRIVQSDFMNMTDEEKGDPSAKLLLKMMYEPMPANVEVGLKSAFASVGFDNAVVEAAVAIAIGSVTRPTL